MSPDADPVLFNAELDAVIAEYFAALERGETLDRQPFIDQHARFADQLRAFFTNHDRMEQAARVRSTGQQTVIYSRDVSAGLVIDGRFKLLENIGEGGMGSVWVAEQRSPVKRRVAVKLVKAGMDSRQVLARFEAERQALALMDHPHIARVFDGGLTEQGRPYFVMEYVKGIPITKYCDEARLSLRDRLKLFVPVCQAVQHAHHKGIVHRDLKPSNILICLYDGQPVPKVIDFGLAKALHQPLTEQSIHTGHGVMLGTPVYMSPEQAEYNNLDVDTRTDVYSLGVVLYELLTGTTPLERDQVQRAAYEEILRLIKDVEPARPSLRLSGSNKLPSIAAQRGLDPRQLCRSLSGDLDWIVMKAVEKERGRRYDTATNLARDIERFLNEEAVEARPPSTAYRLRKFIHRHRREAIAIAVTFTALVLAIVSTTMGMMSAHRAEEATREALHDMRLERDAKEKSLQAESLLRAESERQRLAAIELERVAREKTLHARQYLYAAQMNLVQSAWDSDHVGGVREILLQSLPVEGEADLRGIEWHYWNRLLNTAVSRWRLPATEDDYMEDLPVLSADGSRAATTYSNWSDNFLRIEIWDLLTKQRLTSLPFDRAMRMRPWAFSPDGHRIAIAADGQGSYEPAKMEIRVIDLASGAEVLRLDTGLKFIDGNSLAFSPDGKSLVANVIRTNSEGAETTEWVAWNLDTGQEQARLACPGLARTRFCFSRDGKVIAGIARFDDSGWGTWPRLWNITTGEQITQFPKFDYETLENVVLRPDGAVLAGIERNFSGKTTIYEWSVATGEELNQIERQTFEINQLRYDPDGGFLLGLGGLSIMAWESETDQADLRLPGHESPVCDIAFHPSGRLRSIDEFGNVMQWDISDYYTPEPTVPKVATYVDSVRAVDRQGTRAAYYEDVSKDGQDLHQYDLKVVDRDGDVLVRRALPGRGHYTNEKLQFSPSGSLLAAITTNHDRADGVIHVWETASLAERYTQTYRGGADDVGTKVVDIDLHPAETHLGVLLHEPRSAKVQIIDLSGKSAVRDVFTTPRNPGSWSMGECCRSGLAWSPDGASLAISEERLNESEGNWLRLVLIDATSGAVRWEWTGDVPSTSSPAFSADGKHVAIGVDHAYDGTGPEIHVWDVISGDRLYVLKGHRHPVISVAFHPHEPRLVSASWHDGDEQGEVIVWDLTTGQPVARWNDLDNSQSDGVHFSTDGRRLLFSGHMQLPELSAGEFMIWDGTPVP